MNVPTPDIRNWSIKNKLKAVIILTSLAVLLVLFLVFVVNQRNFLRSSLLQEMDVLSRNIANNCAASVIFGDRPTAGETLESLQANPQVIACIIYDTDGQVFSSYYQQQSSKTLLAYPPVLLLDARHLFSGRHLDIVQTIGYGREQLGILHLRADLSNIEKTLMRYIGFGFLGLGGRSFSPGCLPIGYRGSFQNRSNNWQPSCAQYPKSVITNGGSRWIARTSWAA